MRIVVPVANGLAEVWVHALVLDLPPDDRAACASRLSAEERTRAARYRFAVDRHRFVAARGLLRRVLAEHGAGAPGRLVIIADGDGKPRLEGAGSLRFTVSHSGARGLVAVARGREVGIDVEGARPIADCDAVARWCCTPDEREALARMPLSARAAAFRRGWVRKEACVKASGVGLRAPLDRVAVGVEARAPSLPYVVRAPRADGTLGAWTLVDLDVGADHVAALAVDRGVVIA